MEFAREIDGAQYGFVIAGWKELSEQEAHRQIGTFVREASEKQLGQMDRAFNEVVYVEGRPNERRAVMERYQLFKDFVESRRVSMESEKNKSTFNITSSGQMNLTIQSTLNNVAQHINVTPNIDNASKTEILELVQRLKTALASVPSDKSEEAEVVATYAEELVKDASAEQPKKAKIQISKQGLLQAAKNLASVVPSVLEIATNIASHRVFQ
jgi:hypothetical protein